MMISTTWWIRAATSVLLFGAFAGAALARAGEGTAPARAVVESTADQVLAVLRNKETPVDRRLEALQQIAYQRFDFPTIGRLVLARSWNQLSREQQQAFLEDFKRHLSLDYGRRIDSYTDQTVSIVGDRIEANGDATVKTQVNGTPSAAVTVDYRLRNIDGEWRVIDVIVEGVSLVSSYRSQFQEILSRGGPDRLLQVLREKNEQAATARAS